MQKWHDLQEEEAYELLQKALLGELEFFYLGDFLGENKGFMNMSGYLETVFENKAHIRRWKMIFADLDDIDGVKECILRCEGSERHYNVIFHYDAGKVYVSEITYRDGIFIYENGIVEGSGSASSTCYDRICFENGQKAIPTKFAGWNVGGIPMGSRTEAWITVDGMLV